MIHLSGLFLHQLSFLSIGVCGLCYSLSRAAGLLTTGKKKSLPNTTNPGGVFMSFATVPCTDHCRAMCRPGLEAQRMCSCPPRSCGWSCSTSKTDRWAFLPLSRGQIQPVGLRHMGIYNGEPGLLVMGLPEARGRPPHSSGQGSQQQQKVLVLIL